MLLKSALLCLALSLHAAESLPPLQTFDDRRIEITPTITGTPPFTYQWYRGTATNLLKVKLPGETSPGITLTPPYTSGLYTCEVSNAAGTILTTPTKVSVTKTTSAPDLAITVKNP